MEVPNVKTRDFSLREVIHRPDDIPEKAVPIGYIALGYIQGVRDALWSFYGREIRIKIQSGYRSKRYNRTLVGASSNSFHIWRWEESSPIWALDISSPDLSPEELYTFCKDYVRGETYHHVRNRIVHIAPTGKDEEWVLSPRKS